jgi:hypothetical protein
MWWLWGRICICVYAGHWHTSVPWGYRTEVIVCLCSIIHELLPASRGCPHSVTSSLPFSSKAQSVSCLNNSFFLLLLIKENCFCKVHWVTKMMFNWVFFRIRITETIPLNLASVNTRLQLYLNITWISILMKNWEMGILVEKYVFFNKQKRNLAIMSNIQNYQSLTTEHCLYWILDKCLAEIQFFIEFL